MTIVETLKAHSGCLNSMRGVWRYSECFRECIEVNKAAMASSPARFSGLVRKSQSKAKRLIFMIETRESLIGEKDFFWIRPTFENGDGWSLMRIERFKNGRKKSYEWEEKLFVFTGQLVDEQALEEQMVQLETDLLMELAVGDAPSQRTNAK
jgi:hypothetical protein